MRASLAGTKTIFSETCCIRIIGDDTRHTEVRFTACCQRKSLPTGDVHRQPHGTAVSLYGTTKRDTNRSDGLRNVSPQSIGQCQHRRKAMRGTTGRGRTAPRHDDLAGAGINDASGEFGATKVETEYVTHDARIRWAMLTANA